MPEWQPLNMSMVPGVTPALNAVGEGADKLSDFLDGLADILGTLADMVSAMADATQAAMQALIAAIQELINQIHNLLQTGVYFYLDKGPLFTGETPDGLSGFLSRWKASFDDLGDGDRPQLVGSASISAMLFVVGADDLPEFTRLLGLLAALFGLPALSWETDEYDLDIPTRIENGMSTPPDWESLRLGEVCPPFAQLAEQLTQALGMLSVTDDYAGMLNALSETIEQKSTLLSSIAGEIRALVTDITTLIESAGLYVLRIDGNGVTDLQEKAETAMDAPSWTGEAWVVGTCLLAATADFGPVAELFGG